MQIEVSGPLLKYAMQTQRQFSRYSTTAGIKEKNTLVEVLATGAGLILLIGSYRDIGGAIFRLPALVVGDDVVYGENFPHVRVFLDSEALYRQFMMIKGVKSDKLIVDFQGNTSGEAAGAAHGIFIREPTEGDAPNPQIAFIEYQPRISNWAVEVPNVTDWLEVDSGIFTQALKAKAVIGRRANIDRIVIDLREGWISVGKKDFFMESEISKKEDSHGKSLIRTAVSASSVWLINLLAVDEKVSIGVAENRFVITGEFVSGVFPVKVVVQDESNKKVPAGESFKLSRATVENIFNGAMEFAAYRNHGDDAGASRLPWIALHLNRERDGVGAVVGTLVNPCGIVGNPVHISGDAWKPVVGELDVSKIGGNWALFSASLFYAMLEGLPMKASDEVEVTISKLFGPTMFKLGKTEIQLRTVSWPSSVEIMNVSVPEPTARVGQEHRFSGISSVPTPEILRTSRRIKKGQDYFLYLWHNAALDLISVEVSNEKWEATGRKRMYKIGGFKDFTLIS